MTVAFVLGTRPEIIKMGPVIKECAKREIPSTVIHTGQHYSENLDAVFFEQLDLDTPEYNLGIGSGSQGEQTGSMLAGIEEILLDHSPDVVFVQGDTNSTLAGALAGSKLDMDVAHIEAGLRSYDREMPEEINRVAVDHIADRLYPPTDETCDLLLEEGIPREKITVTGNTIVDALEIYATIAQEVSSALDDLDLQEDEFYLLTAHRAENVDSHERFESLLDGVDRFARQTDTKVLYPIHPRAENRLAEFDLDVPDSIRTIEPLGFLDFLRLEAATKLVFTDSGGVQEESCILGTPCVTLRNGTERPETAFVGANCIAGLEPQDIVDAARQMVVKTGDWKNPFGDGKAAASIIDDLGLEDSD